MSDNRRYQVFVSSTFEDLKEERKKIYETLLQIDCIPAGMEFFGAVDEEQFEFIKTIIDDSDYYLVIVGGRYGTLSEEGISYTEKEYLYAKEKGIPVCALIHGNPENIPAGKTENNSKLKLLLEKFKKELSNSRLVDFWNNSDDISGKVLVALTKTMKRHPRAGWIRGDAQASSEILNQLTIAQGEINNLVSENAALKANNSALEQNTLPEVKITLLNEHENEKIDISISLDNFLIQKFSSMLTNFSYQDLEKSLINYIKFSHHYEIPDPNYIPIKNSLDAVISILIIKNIISNNNTLNSEVPKISDFIFAAFSVLSSRGSLELTNEGRKYISKLI